MAGGGHLDAQCKGGTQEVAQTDDVLLERQGWHNVKFIKIYLLIMRTSDRIRCIIRL